MRQVIFCLFLSFSSFIHSTQTSEHDLEVLRQWGSRFLALKIVGPERDAWAWMKISVILIDKYLGRDLMLSDRTEQERLAIAQLLNADEDLSGVHQVFVQMDTNTTLADLAWSKSFRDPPKNADNTNNYIDFIRHFAKTIAVSVEQLKEANLRRARKIHKMERYYAMLSCVTCCLFAPCAIGYSLRNRCFCCMSPEDKSFKKLIVASEKLKELLTIWNSDYFHEEEITKIHEMLVEATILPLPLVDLINSYLNHQPLLDDTKRFIHTISEEELKPLKIKVVQDSL